MRGPMTEPYEAEAYEPVAEDSDYNWDYDEEPHTPQEPMNILWGRVAILGFVLLLAFMFGRATNGSGIPASELAAAETRAETLAAENEDLKTQLAAQPEVAAPAETEEEPAATEPSEDEGSTEIVGQSYTVERGDTLRGIAQEFYGDPELSDYLAEVNNISDPTTISVGQKLIIPDDPPE